MKAYLPHGIRTAFESLGTDIFYYSSIDSTSDEARRYAEEISPLRPALFIADGQSAGKGRLGRSFFSPTDTGLYMTLLLPDSEKYSFTNLTAISAVVLHDCIKKIFCTDTRIKWVNDLYIADRKVSGILAQSFSAHEQRLVSLGIGVNLSTEDFPSELSGIASSLGVKTDSPEEQKAMRFALAYEICKGLLRALGDSDVKKYMDSYRQLSCVIDKDIRFFENGKEYCGRALDVNERGELIVSVDGAARLLWSGEISVRLK